VSYHNFVNGTQTGPKCAWTGLGGDTTLGESFADGSERHCPQCDRYFGYVAFPLITESLSDPRAPEEDRMFAEIVQRGVAANDASVDAPDQVRRARPRA